MNILGLDLSLTSTGWSLGTDGTSTTGVISAPKGMFDVERLRHLRNSLHNFILKNDLRGNCAAYIEDYAFSANGRIASIGEWGGVARALLADLGIDIYLVAPTTLKKYVLGPTKKGEGGKENMLLGVYIRWGVEFKSNDMADAYALARLGRQQWGFPTLPGEKRTQDQAVFEAIKLLYTAPEADKLPPARERHRA